MGSVGKRGGLIHGRANAVFPAGNRAQNSFVGNFGGGLLVHWMGTDGDSFSFGCSGKDDRTDGVHAAIGIAVFESVGARRRASDGNIAWVSAFTA